MKYALVHAEKAHFPITLMCRLLEVPRSGYYAWRERPLCSQAQADVALGVEVAAVYREKKGRYGSPRIHQELQARGKRVGRKRVARLMRERDLRARVGKRWVKTTDSNHDHPIVDNVLNRNFTTVGPNRVWAGDITFIWTAQGWLYLAVVLDLFSRKVVGWATSECIDRALVAAALQMALRRRQPPAGLLHHSDRGSQYTSADYRKQLADAGIVCSMSRKGDCWDNAVVESFNSTLKLELVYTQDFSTRAEAHQSLAEYLESFYNVDRRHSSLGYLSPVDYERAAAAKTAMAA